VAAGGAAAVALASSDRVVVRVSSSTRSKVCTSTDSFASTLEAVMAVSVIM
jgi:hypothetical protein